MSATVRKRPIVISIICVLGFIVSAGQIIAFSYPGIRAVGKWYPVVYGFLVAFRFMSLVGIWHMKKWGAELFAYAVLVKFIIQMLVGDLTAVSMGDLSLATGFAVIFLSFHGRMDKNL